MLKKKREKIGGLLDGKKHVRIKKPYGGGENGKKPIGIKKPCGGNQALRKWEGNIGMEV